MSDDVQGGPAGPADAAPNAHEPASLVDERKRGPMLIGLVTAIVVIGIVYFLYDYFIGSRAVSTDNAYVAGETAIVTPLVSGKVIEVLVSDTQPVRRGQVLFRLDDADQRIAVAQAEAQLEYARRYFGRAVANRGALGAAAGGRRGVGL